MTSDRPPTTVNDDGFDFTGYGGTTAGDIDACSYSTALANESDLNEHLMDRIVEGDNLNAAYTRVVRNKGAAGVDGMTVDQLLQWSREHKQDLTESLTNGRYKPSPVRGVKIPKPSGGMRQLGIPTAVDRMVQQAISQLVGPILEKKFSESSFGFRPGRSVHDALNQASEYVRQGNVFVVDIDLEKFFDRVNHDKLMVRLARHVKDKRVLKITRALLNAGLMENGVVQKRGQGTPQGGPLTH